MLYNKFDGHMSAGFAVEDYWRVIAIYGYGNHRGHMTWTIWTNFRFAMPLKLQMKFGFDWHSAFWEKVFEECGRRTTDGACLFYT